MKKFYSAVAALVCFTVFLLPLQGCFTQSELASLTETLGTATASLEQIEGNTAAAQTIAADTTAAVNAINNWKSGTPAQDVLQALAILQNDISLLPISPQDQALVDLALGTAETIIAIISANQPNVVAAVTLSPHRMVVSASIHDKREFKKQWNAILTTHPQFASTHIN